MSENKKGFKENKDLEKAIDEMDILNPENKEVYQVDSETIKLSNKDYQLIENYKDGFDLEQLENRYSEYLLKYDYIVGDIAYQKLRLRGFFDDHRKGVPIDMKISHLEDYLVEFCSFGSPYFVLERVHKNKKNPDSYFKKKKHKKKRNRKKKSSHTNSQRKNKEKQRGKNKKSKEKKQENKKKKKKRKKDFKIRKKKD